MSSAVNDRPRPRRVRPYPLDELPRLLRAQVELSRVLWRHIRQLIDAAAASSAAGRAELESQLGGELKLSAQEPYLAVVERLPALLRGGQLYELSQNGPGQPAAVLAIDEKLAAHLGIESDAMVDVLSSALRGAPLRVAAVSAADVTAILGRDETPLRSLLVLDLSVMARGELGWARLLTSAQLRLQATPPPSSTALERIFERRQRIQDVRVPLSLEAGYGFLPGRELTAMQPGDVVVLDHFGPKPVTGGPVWLRLGGGVFPGHLDGAGVTVLGSFYLRAQAMPQSTNEQTEEAGGGAVEGAPHPTNEALLRELPVQITCEIGRVTLSAREVLELRPGAVVPVGRPLAGPVDLTAGGRVIARGELVDVEGEIGVRVTEVQD